VGAFLSQHFAAGWKKIGTFAIIPMCEAMNLPPPPRRMKLGGNVVAYFCTPDLKILAAVWGPESANRFLEQATWAVELWKRLAGLEPDEKVAAARSAHEENPYRLRSGLWTQAGMDHLTRMDCLKEKVLTPLDKSAAELFQQLVNEKASEEEVRVDLGFDPVRWNGEETRPTPSSRRRP
jgi:hypothetical protein